jgi:hypothetical protein
MPGDVAEGQLEAEGRVFGRYLIGRVPPPEVVARYVQASRLLFTAPVAPEEAAVVAFARRHPWSVPFLDAAAGLLRPGSLLRSKLLVLAAILEAAPALADEFLPRNVSPVGLLVRLAASGTKAVLQAVLGALLHPIVARSRA